MSTHDPEGPGRDDRADPATDPVEHPTEPYPHPSPDAGTPQPDHGPALPPYGSDPAPTPGAAAQTGGNRALWIGLGIGGAVVAALVLVGGVAFGFAVGNRDDGHDGWRHAPMMSGRQGPSGSDEGGQGLGMAPGGPGQGPGDGYGDRDGDVPGVPGGPMSGGLMGALHGQLVVPDGSGWTTVAMQRGTATAVSTTSLTVRSDDGYTATYRVTDATRVTSAGAGPAAGAASVRASVAEGDDVDVLARGARAPFTAQVVAVG